MAKDTYRELPYTTMSPFDLWRASQAGGKIIPKGNSKIVYRFTKSQYERYLQLNFERENRLAL